MPRPLPHKSGVEIPTKIKVPRQIEPRLTEELGKEGDRRERVLFHPHHRKNTKNYLEILPLLPNSQDVGSCVIQDRERGRSSRAS